MKVVFCLRSLEGKKQGWMLGVLMVVDDVEEALRVVNVAASSN
jgi:hypothetical protein